MAAKVVPLALAILLISAVTLWASGDATPEGCFTIESKGIPSRIARRQLEGAEHEFHQLTRWEADASVSPIKVTLCGSDEVPSLGVDATEGEGPSITLRLHPETSDPRNIPLVSASLLLREYYGKTAPVPGSTVPCYPDWVLRGLGTLIMDSKNPGSGVVPESPELEAFLTERAPDPDQSALISGYDRLASRLVRSGLSDEAGRKAFRGWVGQVDPSAPTRKPAPWVTGWEMRSVERRWVLSLRASGGDGGGDASRIAPAGASLDAYEGLLRSFLDGKSSLEDVRRERGGEFRLNQLVDKLTALRLQASPLVVPLIDETISLLRHSKRMSSSSLAKEEQRLRDETQALRRRSSRISDYLNWFEAARSSSSSGMFDRYLSSRPPVIKKGPLGRAVDAVESRGW